MNETIHHINQLFSQFGNNKYDELISQTEHATQCAALAKASGATPELTIAALLHDIGHLLVLAENNGTIDFDTDDEHAGWDLCMKFAENGLLAKPTHHYIIRLAPPLVISKEQIDECVAIIAKTFKEYKA